MATVKEIIELAESKMHKTTDVLRVDLASVRAGRATPALLEKVMNVLNAALALVFAL